VKLVTILLEAFEAIYVLMVDDKDNQFKEYNLKLLREWIERLRRFEAEEYVELKQVIRKEDE